MRIGKRKDGIEVRVEDRKGGGANIAFIKDGKVVSLALTGNARETKRELRGVKFGGGK